MEVCVKVKINNQNDAIALAMQGLEVSDNPSFDYSIRYIDGVAMFCIRGEPVEPLIDYLKNVSEVFIRDDIGSVFPELDESNDMLLHFLQLQGKV